MDSKKCLFWVQIYTDSNKIMLNLKPGSDFLKKAEKDSQIVKQIENSKKTTCYECLSKSVSSIGVFISNSMKKLCWFKSKENLMSFIVYKNMKNPINFAFLNMFFLVWFTLDLILWSTIPLFFHASPVQRESVSGEKESAWGRGMLLEAHYFMASYFFIMFWIEYFYVQYLYWKICHPCSPSRTLYPLKSCFFSFLAKLDIYTDVCMTVEIFKWKDKPDTKTYFIILFSFSFCLFWISVLYQVWWFIRMLIRKQPKSTFNSLYSNTSWLAYSASFKWLGEFIDRFSIQYYGRIFARFNAKQELALVKLIVEDWLQWLVQILFLLMRKSTDGVYIQIFFSLFLSIFSAFTSIAVIFTDATSPLSLINHKSIGILLLITLFYIYIAKEYKFIDDPTSNYSVQLEAVDINMR